MHSVYQSHYVFEWILSFCDLCDSHSFLLDFLYSTLIENFKKQGNAKGWHRNPTAASHRDQNQC